MFGKTKDEMVLETVIGAETLLQGTIKTKSGVRIDGRFEGGNIEGKCVIVGSTGIVNADITAEKVIVGGKVTGAILATKRLEIQTNAQVYGDIQTASLSIAEGAIYEGHCIMSAEEIIAEKSSTRK